ncbi:MAG: TonB-dependent receptor [Saprospiraceae bacterium]
MLKHFPKILLLFLFICTAGILQAQSLNIQGKVVDETNAPVARAVIRVLAEETYSRADGTFELRVLTTANQVAISISAPNFRSWEQNQEIPASRELELGTIQMITEENIGQIASEDIIPTITLSTDEDAVSQNISGLLTASNDVFISAAAYNFGPYRFNIRGYNSDQTTMLINGAPVNDVESGGLFWSRWGGLNDVLRNRSLVVGLDANNFSFGGVGGANMIDTRAAGQRKQLRVSYALSNRAYRNRIMATWSSGLLPGGWAVSLSGSRRWAQEGYVDGTFYDAYSYFLSVDKKFNDHHSFNLTAFGAPVIRGRSGASTQEMYDLAGSNYYNSYWGYQNGEKRNSRVVNAHQPMIILRHDLDLSDKTHITTALSTQFGRYGSSALDWYNARDPRPDYYRKLPSYIQDDQAVAVEALLRNDESARQLDWHRFYNVNRNNIQTIKDADGIAGNDVTGKRAQYVVEERRYDSQTSSFNTILESNVNEHLTINGGLMYQLFRNKSFKVLDDLLGADFYVNIDKFAEFEDTGDASFIQNDLDKPNGLVREGDIFGYDYYINVGKGNAWLQGDLTFNRVDFFLAGQLGFSEIWRDGQVRNGKFPDRSLGESEKAKFTEYAAKGGLTYKIDGRNYLFANGSYQQRAPFARYTFQSPRTRNDLVENLMPEKITSIEGGYLLKAPYAKARAVGYFTTMKDQLYNRSLFLDDPTPSSDETSSGFVNYIMNGVDTRHMGVELALEARVLARLKMSAVAAIGEHTYTNRPSTEIYVDNSGQKFTTGTKYLKNFYVANGPQHAYTLGLNYEGKEYWFANLNLNYFNHTFIDIYPERRSLEAVSNVSDPQFQQQVVDPESQLWKDILYQEQVDGGFTLDFFGGKSWKFNKVFLYLNVGVNNILDNKDLITGGYEQFRFDFEGKDVGRFPNRYFYSFGRNYFISLAFRY